MFTKRWNCANVSLHIISAGLRQGNGQKRENCSAAIAHVDLKLLCMSIAMAKLCCKFYHIVKHTMFVFYQADTVKLIYAYGEDDPSGDDLSQEDYHNQARGKSSPTQDHGRRKAGKGGLGPPLAFQHATFFYYIFNNEKVVSLVSSG